MLKGTKVILRAFEREDLPNAHRWINDWEVLRFLSPNFPQSMVEEERWFDSLQGRSDIKTFAIVTHEGRHIGTVDLRNIGFQTRSAELGIMIGEKDCWSQGYGTDAIKTLLSFAFQNLNLHRVYLRTFEFNSRGQRCFEKCGFKQEGALREAVFRDGRYWDVIEMGILEDEWRSNEGGAHARG